MKHTRDPWKSMVHDFIPCRIKGCDQDGEHCDLRWCGAPRNHPMHTCYAPQRDKSPAQEVEKKKWDDAFWNGFAMALAEVNRKFDLPTAVKSVMEGYGVSLKRLQDAGVEEYDMKQIRKAMR